MNGRVYDYNLGRFMSVDPVIQSPANSQSINPYSYIMNNPLAGTDPTGYMSRINLKAWEDWRHAMVGLNESSGSTGTSNGDQEKQSSKESGGTLSVVDLGSPADVASSISTIETSSYNTTSVTGEKIPAYSYTLASSVGRSGFTSTSITTQPIGANGSLDLLGKSLLNFGKKLLLGGIVMEAAQLCGSSSGSCDNEYINVYRGTNSGQEAMVQMETGMIMSDSARRKYNDLTNLRMADTGELNPSDIDFARIQAVAEGYTRHAELVSLFGGESNLARVQSLSGTEFPNAPRSMFSVTTDINVARRFGRNIYQAKVKKSMLIKTPVNGTESEYFIRSAHYMSKIE